MTILSLNVWGGRRQEQLLPFLEQQAESVDLFCLQEVYSRATPADHPAQMELVPDIAEQIVAVLPSHEMLLATSRDSWGERLALYIRRSLPLIAHGDRTLVTTVSPERRSSGSVYLQFVNVGTARGPLSIGHLHGYWEPDEGEDKPPRAEQIDNLLRFIDEESTPVVLCGDFNMNRHSRGIDRLSERLTNLNRVHDIPTTRPSWNRYYGTVADYVFTSPELTVRRFEVLPNEAISDHLALLVELDV